MITDLQPGEVYQLKAPNDQQILIQIGQGGDCGVFCGESIGPTFLGSPIFRVLVNQKDLKRHWRKRGSFPLSSMMQSFAFYGDHDIGTNNYYQVSLEAVDIRTPIVKDRFDRIERLSVWETIHILDRYKSVQDEIKKSEQ
jgi:hypothetical protein